MHFAKNRLEEGDEVLEYGQADARGVEEEVARVVDAVLLRRVARPRAVVEDELAAVFERVVDGLKVLVYVGDMLGDVHDGERVVVLAHGKELGRAADENGLAPEQLAVAVRVLLDVLDVVDQVGVEERQRAHA